MEPSDTGFNTPDARRRLTQELPGLPQELAQEADVFTLAMTSATWLEIEEQIQERERERARGRGRVRAAD